MNIMLNFMDKIYSDDKAMTMVYIVGAVLLFIFIVLLIFSLRKPSKKNDVNIIDEVTEDKKEDVKEEIISEDKDKEKKDEIIEKTDNVVEEEKKEETTELNSTDVKEQEEVVEDKSDTNIFEKTTIIPLENVKVNENELTKEENIEKALDNVSKEHKVTPLVNEEIDNNKISADIPNVDEFVDNVVKKTYEKNQQFSSVYVGDNTSTMKLDKVMDQVNMDKDVKKEITGVDTTLDDSEKIRSEESSLGIKEESASDLVKEEIPSKLDNLKEALEEKKEEEIKKETTKDETTAINKEDLLNKLNALKK